MKRLIMVCCMAASLSACAPNYSEGERVGVITKLSHKGLIWKSWEGSINQGGTRTEHDKDGNPMAVPNAMDFNVQDPELVKRLQQAAESGMRIKITYSQWFLPPLTIENGRVVTAVSALD